MTFLIVKVLTPELTQKAVRIDLNTKKTTHCVRSILEQNKIKFSKVLKWNYYNIDESITVQ